MVRLKLSFITLLTVKYTRKAKMSMLFERIYRKYNGKLTKTRENVENNGINRKLLQGVESYANYYRKKH